MKKSFYSLLILFSVMALIAVSQADASQVTTNTDEIGTVLLSYTFSKGDIVKDTTGSILISKGKGGNGSGGGTGKGGSSGSGSGGNSGSGAGTGTGKTNGGKSSGYGPGDGTGTGSAPQDGTGNGSKSGNCTQTSK